MGKSSKRKHDDSDDEINREHKKSSKKIEKVAKLLGYSNETNPFGDSNLLQPFVWKKKEEKNTVDVKSSSIKGKEKSTDKRLGLLQEIEKVRKRREDRENELAEMEKLRFEEQRLREAASFGDWQKKEEEFHTEQIRVRSVIRIIEGREKLIDLIMKNIILSESIQIDNKREDDETKHKLSGIDVEMTDPCKLITEAETSDDLHNLLDDIDAYIELEKMKGSNVKYLESIKLIAVSEIRKRKGSQSKIHRSVMRDVESRMKGKSSSELDRLQSDIELNIRENKLGDREYWEEMASEVRLQRAKAFVTEIHDDLLKRHLEYLSIVHANNNRKRSVKSEDDDKNEDTDVDNSAEAKAFQRKEEERGLEADEGLMQNDEVAVNKIYAWQDKYQPRKPRYFNRVRTGYDWHKYNATHYDRDNPPPRMIQGYKFCIFYPDLVDATKTPKYFLEPSDSNDTAIIRFHAGPPYQDIAFKIINKQWDTHPYAGFKCVFDRGILQLHFNFKRAWYRR